MKKISAVILSSLILFFVTGQSLFPQTTSEQMKLGLVGVGLHAEQYKISDALSNYSIESGLKNTSSCHSTLREFIFSWIIFSHEI